MKKIFLSVSVLALLAAGCNSAQPAGQNNNPSTAGQQSSGTGANTPAQKTPSPNGLAWQGTLQASDSPAKGNYMISVSGHMLYLRTSRDFSQLVGKAVNVSYSGDQNSFTLENITAQ